MGLNEYVQQQIDDFHIVFVLQSELHDLYIAVDLSCLAVQQKHHSQLYEVHSYMPHVDHDHEQAVQHDDEMGVKQLWEFLETQQSQMLVIMQVISEHKLDETKQDQQFIDRKHTADISVVEVALESDVPDGEHVEYYRHQQVD